MKKIMFYSMTLNSGGAERVITNLANELSYNNNIAIATLFNTKIDYVLNKNITLFSPPYNSVRFLVNRIKNIKYLINNTIKFNPDTIIAFCPTMCFIACFFKMFSKKFKNIKLIISERNNPSSEYSNIFLKCLANFLYARADVIVFQTEDAMNFFNKTIINKSVIIPNPINAKFLNVSKNIKKENCIVNVGRLEPQKNQELLIRSFFEVYKSFPEWKLIIYGDGSLKNELEKLIIDLGLQDSVFLFGKCSHLEMELPKYKIFVLSSNYEGMPNSLLEAMACGLTCISTDCPCGGPKSIINNNINGYLFSVNDLDSMTKAIINAINNPLVENRNALKKYDISNIISKWIDLL